MSAIFASEESANGALAAAGNISAEAALQASKAYLENFAIGAEAKKILGEAREKIINSFSDEHLIRSLEKNSMTGLSELRDIKDPQKYKDAAGAALNAVALEMEKEGYPPERIQVVTRKLEDQMYEHYLELAKGQHKDVPEKKLVNNPSGKATSKPATSSAEGAELAPEKEAFTGGFDERKKAVNGIFARLKTLDNMLNPEDYARKNEFGARVDSQRFRGFSLSSFDPDRFERLNDASWFLAS